MTTDEKIIMGNNGRGGGGMKRVSYTHVGPSKRGDCFGEKGGEGGGVLGEELTGVRWVPEGG